MKLTTELIVVAACKAKFELKDGDLANHIGCAFDNWANDARKSIHPVFEKEVEADIAMIRAELATLGFNW